MWTGTCSPSAGRTGCATGIRPCGATGDERVRHAGWSAQAMVAHRLRRAAVARDAAWRDPRPAGPLGERQDHGAALAGRVRGPRRRSDRARRRGRDRGAARPATLRHGVPAFRAVPTPRCRGECRLWTHGTGAEQTGWGGRLYEPPACLFVATFVGRANVLRGKTAQVFGAGPGEVLVLRPERLTLADAGVPGVVRERRYTGAAAFYLVEMEPGDRVEVLARPEAARVGDRVYLEAARVLTFPEEQA